MSKTLNPHIRLITAVLTLAIWSATATAAIIYVDADAPGPVHDGESWCTAYNFLQDALTDPNLELGDNIRVAEGTYRPDQDSDNPGGTDNRNETFELINDVEIYGGYAGCGAPDPDERKVETYETILTGVLSTRNSLHVVTGSGTNATAVLDGFTITGGNATSSSGGGMFNYNPPGSPTVVKCLFKGNSTAYRGGGMYNWSGSAPTLIDCSFENNSADLDGGGLYNTSASPTISNCTFTGNSASRYGGGLCNDDSDPVLINCTFSNNIAGQRGGGTYNWSTTTDLEFVNCTYTGNLAGEDGGGMCIWNGTANLVDCLFSGNTATQDGGAMYNNAGDPTVINCTFAENDAKGNGGGIFNNELAFPTIANSIFWANTDSAGTAESAQINGGFPQVTYSCIQDEDPNDGAIPFNNANIDDDPMFVRDPNAGGDGWGDDPCTPGPDEGANDDYGDLHLLPGSPCIDAADNTMIPADTHDLDYDLDTTELTPLDLDYNPRFLDDPTTANTGNPDPSHDPNIIVDMGSYEYEYVPAGPKYCGGTGTAEDPYLICDPNHMQEIGANPDDWGKHFKLMADIDLARFTGTEFNIIGTGPGFNGTFNGNGHTISSFIYDSNGIDNIGLFSHIGSSGKIQRLALIDVNVNAGTGWDIGGLAANNSGSITNCQVSGSVSGNHRVGGLVGSNGGGISNCKAFGNVNGSTMVGGLLGVNGSGSVSNCEASVTVVGTNDVGGLAGVSRSGIISGCKASGTVTGNNSVGGLVGYSMFGSISDSYASDDVSGDDEVGGLVGQNSGAITNCYSAAEILEKIYWIDGYLNEINRSDLNGANREKLFWGLRKPDGIALDTAGGKMYWTDFGTDKIQRANLDGSNVEDLVTGLDRPSGIALDTAAGKMYWTDADTDKIQRANLDGTYIEDLVTSGLSGTYHIALDTAGGKMYWTDSNTHKIQRADLDGTNVEDLITSGLSYPKGIAVDTAAGKMYWTDWDTDKIQRANLDGTDIEDLVTSGLSSPHDMVLDNAAEKMYWTDSSTDKIQRANLDGTNVEDLVTSGLSGPHGIALDTAAGKIYWVNFWKNKIQRSNLDGSNAEDLTSSIFNPSGIAVDLADRKMYWTDYYINRANLDSSNVDVIVIFPTTSLPYDIALDTTAGKMYWTINEPMSVVQRANLDGSNVEDLVTSGLTWPSGIALDVASGKMYWANGGEDKIQRANLDGSNVEDLVIGLWPYGNGLALDTTAGKMYWTDYDKIRRANLDGSDVVDILTVNPQGENSALRGIALDTTAGKMYWTDTSKDKIQRANLDGSNVEDIITSGLSEPHGIALALVTNGGGLVGFDDGGSYTKCFWDSDINPDVNGIGNGSDPNVIGESTTNMQIQSTYTSVGWDFVDETANGTDDIWKICEGAGYPRLWWEARALDGDVSNDCQVNLVDLAIVSYQWLDAPGDPSADIAPPGGDGMVNGDDLLVVAANWLAGAEVPAGEIIVNLSMDESWMYQNLSGSTNSELTATASIIDDPAGNSSYTYEWEFVLPVDVSVEPSTITGGGPADASWNFAAPNVNQTEGLSDSGQSVTVRVTVTGNDYSNSGLAEAQFGIALLGDVNNETNVNIADRSIINAFWRTGSAGNFTLRDCDINSDGTVNIADRSIANAVWRGQLGQNSVTEPCPLRND